MHRLTTDEQQEQLDLQMHEYELQKETLNENILELEGLVERHIREMDFDKANDTNMDLKLKKIELAEVDKKLEWILNFENYLQKHAAKIQSE